MQTQNNDFRSVLTRGVEDVIVKEDLERALASGKKLRIKLGIDPTGPNIHLGRAIPLRKLRAFQDLGHTAVLIVGDFTALIGDPSDKLAKRPMLTPGDVKTNMKRYKEQLGSIVDLRRAELHYNSKWLKKMNLGDMARLAESFSVQQMVARRNFKDRWDRNEEISLREFLYPLMQGYDSVAVHADVEIGGFDQLFNLKAGRIVQKHYGEPEQNILTTKMLLGLDGRKMTTTWGNTVAINDEPNDMFGKIMSLDDSLMSDYFLLCTDMEEAEIAAELARSPRDTKMRLAREIVSIYHSKQIGEKAEAEFKRIFSEKKINEAELPILRMGSEKSINADDIVLKSGVVLSRNAARRIIEQGGFEINGKKIMNPQDAVSLHAGDVVKIGKKDFFRIG
ncbi:MAG: tyrosine--tRNA ligase [Patescibacteria group bacterium]